jgi:hypothetical protein
MLDESVQGQSIVVLVLAIAGQKIIKALNGLLMVC